MELNAPGAARAAQTVYGTPAETPATGDDGRFADALQAVSATVQSGPALLTTAALSAAHRPDIKTFMDSSGASFEDAAELLYGVVGSNTDTRDWQAIMASGDPVTAARRATGQMYGDPGAALRGDAGYLGDADTVARSGPFALRQLKNDDGELIDSGLKLVDAHGLLLRDAGRDAASMRRNAWLFGMDIAQAAPLVAPAAQVDAGLQAQLREAVGPVALATAMAASPAVATSVPAALVDGAIDGMDAADPLVESAPAEPAGELAAAAGDASAMPADDGDASTVAPGYAAQPAAAPAFIDTASVLQSLMKLVDG